MCQVVEVGGAPREGDTLSQPRDWSLITGRGGGATKHKTGGGAHEVLPLQKGGTEKVLAMLKGGAQNVLG